MADLVVAKAVYARIDRRRKMPATVLLKALAYSTQNLLDHYYDTESIYILGKGRYEKSVNIELLLGQRATRDIRHPDTNEVIVRKNRKFTRSAIKQLQKLKVKRISIDEEEVISSVSAVDVLDEALAVYDLAYSQNYLEESKDLVQYARLALNGNVSYKAAAILEKGFEAGIVERTEKNLKLMANALLVSREPKRALPYLREGAAMSDNGELHLFIGQTLADLDRWGEAAQAYNDALHAGGLRNPGEALIMQGVAYTTAKQYKRAKMAFERARGFKEHALTASQWLNHLTQKMN